MEELTQWIPTISTVFMAVGMAFVADSNIKRHEAMLLNLVSKVQSLETEVALLKAFQGKD
jgi:hypothetical protein